MYLILVELRLLESLFGLANGVSSFISTEVSVGERVDEDQRSLIPFAVFPMLQRVGGDGRGGSVEK